MPGIACVGVDIAGGVQLGAQATKFRVRGNLAVVVGDAVAGHTPFLPPHIPSPTMAQGSPKFRILGIPVCREGDAASCGHSTSGRPFFRIP